MVILSVGIMQEGVYMDEIQKTLLMQVADLHEVPTGAYNIRSNGESAGRHSNPRL